MLRISFALHIAGEKKRQVTLYEFRELFMKAMLVFQTNLLDKMVTVRTLGVVKANPSQHWHSTLLQYTHPAPLTHIRGVPQLDATPHSPRSYTHGRPTK